MIPAAYMSVCSLSLTKSCFNNGIGYWHLDSRKGLWSVFVSLNSHSVFASMWQCTVQWNLSIVDTTGTQLAVLYREVSLIQRYVVLYAVLRSWDSRQCPH